MRHIKNLEQWYLVPTGEILTFRGDAERTVEIELNAVGPCSAYVQRLKLDDDAPDPKKKAIWTGERYLLGTFEGLEAFRWRLDGNFGVVLEHSPEVWARRDQSPVSLPEPEGESYTRFEKAGLYVDELGTMLHRQAVLTRMSNSQAQGEERRENASLRRRLDDMAAMIEKLSLSAEPLVETPANVE